VLAVDLNEKALAEAFASDAAILPAAGDVSDPAFVDQCFDQAKTDLGGIHVLVNCAGITRDDWIWRLGEDAWQSVMDVNLKGTFLTTRALARHVKSLEEAEPVDRSVVNISSIVGKCGNMGQANYAASKAGVVGLSKSAAKDMARLGVRVNAIQPGFIQTPMAAAVPDKVIQQMLQQVPLRRLGHPDEIANLVTFLASPRAAYITGGVFEVTGGLWM